VLEIPPCFCPLPELGDEQSGERLVGITAVVKLDSSVGDHLDEEVVLGDVPADELADGVRPDDGVGCARAARHCQLDVGQEQVVELIPR
jgi:hypothetical protein